MLQKMIAMYILILTDTEEEAARAYDIATNKYRGAIV